MKDGVVAAAVWCVVRCFDETLDVVFEGVVRDRRCAVVRQDETNGITEARVDALTAQDEGDHPVVDCQRTGQQWEGTLVGARSQANHVVAEERRLWIEEQPRRELFLGTRTEQIECERDSRPLARDVVMQIAVQLFVAPIELRREADDDALRLERGPLTDAGEANERKMRVVAAARSDPSCDALLQSLQIGRVLRVLVGYLTTGPFSVQIIEHRL